LDTKFATKNAAHITVYTHHLHIQNRLAEGEDHESFEVWQRSIFTGPDGEFLAIFCIQYFLWAACSTFQTCILNSH